MRSLRDFTPSAIVTRACEDASDAFTEVLSMFPVVEQSALLKQLSLHLPQYSWEENLSRDFIQKEARRLASRLQLLQHPYVEDLSRKTEDAIPLEDLQFGAIDEDAAEVILGRFHYLLSFREQSIHLGFKVHSTDRFPIAMVTLSAFDLSNIASSLPSVDDQRANPLVVSRVFAFDAVPRNTISNLLSKVRAWIAVNLPAINLLVTYLNPNMGFTGASYKADNWTLLGNEWGTRYFYLNRNYITDRGICKQFGRAPREMEESWSEYGISVSRYRLLPLELYIRGISKSYHWRLPELKFRRWAPESVAASR